MPAPREFVSVYVTIGSEEDAIALARALLERRLVACANVLPGRSLYRWQGEIEDARECVMFLKTRRALVPAVEAAVAELHPYDVPCCVALDIASGLAPYLEWVDRETRSEPQAPS